MKTCTVGIVGAAVAGSLVVGQATADSGTSRPRVILHLLMDDFGWADVGSLPFPFFLFCHGEPRPTNLIEPDALGLLRFFFLDHLGRLSQQQFWVVPRNSDTSHRPTGEARNRVGQSLRVQVLQPNSVRFADRPQPHSCKRAKCAP